MAGEVIHDSTADDPLSGALTAEELEARYPGLLDAWRRGDDTTWQRVDELLEFELDADEAEIGRRPPEEGVG